MKKLIVVIIIISVLEHLVCRPSLILWIAYIARVLFICKLIGMKIRLGWLVGLETTALGLYVLTPILFKGHLSGLKVLMIFLCLVVSIALEWYDDYTYVYIEEEG